MYALVEVDGDKVTMTAILDDGRVADECVIDKTKDEIRPYRIAPVFGPGRTRVFFKGADLGLCNMETPAVCKDGVWSVNLATLISYIGGEVKREKGKIILEVYGKKAEFAENSDVALTDKGEIKLDIPVFRGHMEQLYVPVDGVCKAFGFKWAYAKRNNFITIETVNESVPVPYQP